MRDRFVALVVSAVLVALGAYLGGLLLAAVGSAISLSTFGADAAWNAAVPWFNLGLVSGGAVALLAVLLWWRRGEKP